MIRTLDLVCSECGEAFVPSAQLYYRDNYMNTSIRDTKFICADCIAKWKAKWQIKNAIFHEEDYVMTCLLYTSPSPRDVRRSRMPSSA